MMSKQHHPSCRESDRDLVWHCSQCGLNEPVEPTRWTWEQEGTSVLVSVNEENGDRCYFHCTLERWAELAVESHNAALAAEREQRQPLKFPQRIGTLEEMAGDRGREAEFQQLHEQLAAEREKVWTEAHAAYKHEIQQLHEQLNAERNRAEQWKQLHAEISEAWLAEKTRAEALEEALAQK